MKFEWGYLFGMVLQTVPEPRKVAREILALNFSRAVLWQTLGLILVAMTFLGVISSILFPIDPADFGPLVSDPILVGVVEASVAVLTVFGIYWVGRALGGTGTFPQAILTVIWLQFVLMILEIGVLIFGLFAPGLALILWSVGAVMGFWIMTHFITEMHGFRSAGLVFVGIVLTIFAAIVVMSIVLTLIGVGAGVATGGL